MKILLTGDWHLTNAPPKKRIDDYPQNKKLCHILGLAHEYNCSLILQPGDFFDSHKAIDFLKRAVIKTLKDVNDIPIKTIFGQHDLRYHSSDTKNTPLRVLEAAGVLSILGSKPKETQPTQVIESGKYPPKKIHSNVHLYGASWFEDIPEIITDGINILVIHKMIIKNKKLWEGQEDARMANVLLRTTNFDLIVSGDNHNAFVCSYKNRHLINCGSLMRMTTAQLDHEPCVYIYDTDDRTIEKHLIPIEPSEKVFDLSTIEQEKKENKELEAFVSRLKDNVKIDGLDYAKNLKQYIKENDIEQGTLDIIKEVMNGRD